MVRIHVPLSSLSVAIPPIFGDTSEGVGRFVVFCVFYLLFVSSSSSSSSSSSYSSSSS